MSTIVSKAVEQLKTFNLQPPPPPPVPPPPPKPRRSEDEEGGRRAGQESRADAGGRPAANDSGAIAHSRREGRRAPAAHPLGRGSRGQRDRRGRQRQRAGGGGTGGFTPARKLTQDPRSRIPALRGDRTRLGGASPSRSAWTRRVASNCRIVRSSGNPRPTALMCQLTFNMSASARRAIPRPAGGAGCHLGSRSGPPAELGSAAGAGRSRAALSASASCALSRP